MFLSAFRPAGEPLHRADLFGHTAVLRRRGGVEPATVLEGTFAAVAAEGPRTLRPYVARWRSVVAVGDVRLDNRSELAALCRDEVPASASDLEVVARALDAHGERILPSVLGDFGFVAWDARAGKLLAARDPFGVKPLYYRVHGDTLLLASRMDLLAMGDAYDPDHIADLLLAHAAPADRTIWAGVRPVPAGGLLVQRGTVREGRRFWSPDDLVPADAIGEREAIDGFHALFREAVARRTGAPGATWAQLSGGLDSSSVLAMAHHVAGGPAVAGAVTVVDSLGLGDERRYSDAVLRRYDVRGEQVRDYWAWQDDGAPPETDAPRPLYPFFARDRRMCDIVRTAGGRVVLSGFGSDHYLMGHLDYVADLARGGRVGEAVREVARWSTGARQSFWTLAGEHLLRPFLPAALRRRGAAARPPAWIAPDFARRHELAARLEGAAGGAAGGRFAGRMIANLRTIPSWVDRWPYGEDVEVRYPFLYRPLVEFAMRLPVHMRVRPEGTKWVLREAMKGMLPEEVRRRQGKGTIDARIVWSLQRERHRLDELLRDPILAQLGCVDGAAFRRAVDDARRGLKTSLVFLVSALSLETWLAVRHGRWTAAQPAARTAA